MLQLSTNVKRMKLKVFINKDMPIHFINSKLLLVTAYKVTDKLQNRCILLPIAIVIVPVHHSCM